MDLREIKLCLLGVRVRCVANAQDAGVGKSSLVHRFVSDAFAPNLESTIGYAVSRRLMPRASYMSKTLVVDGTSYKYQIWDTAGQEKVHELCITSLTLAVSRPCSHVLPRGGGRHRRL